MLRTQHPPKKKISQFCLAGVPIIVYPLQQQKIGAGSEGAPVQVRQPLADFQHEKRPAEFNETGEKRKFKLILCSSSVDATSTCYRRNQPC